MHNVSAIPEQNTGRSPKAIFILWIPLLKSWVKKLSRHSGYASFFFWKKHPIRVLCTCKTLSYFFFCNLLAF